MPEGSLHQIPSRTLGRRVFMWQFGWWGEPVVVFPTAGGMAHDWLHNGAVAALWPLVEAGRIKLYCPETNVAECWTHGRGSPEHRLARHRAYEDFVTGELLAHIRADVRDPHARVAAIGASIGGWYAVNLALKHPETCWWATSLSGRFAMDHLLDGYWSDDLYYDLPFHYARNLHGAELQKVQRHTRITLVVGQGAHEGACLPETVALGRLLQAKGIATELDVWGRDVAHTWPWWHRQARYHLTRRLA